MPNSRQIEANSAQCPTTNSQRQLSSV